MMWVGHFEIKTPIYEKFVLKKNVYVLMAC